MKKSFFILLCCLVTLSMMSGCGKARPEGLPDLYPCTVTVVQEGTPLPNATVAFHAMATEADSWPIVARTDENGTAVMMTRSDYEGVPLGDYKVVISAVESVKGKEVKDEGGDVISTPITQYLLVTPEFGNLEKTPLTVSVVAGENHFDLNAGKKTRTLYEPK